MNEENMIESAAVAAGYRIHGWIGGRLFVVKGPNPADDFDPFHWQPIEDDGDAFHLMVSLRLECIFDALGGSIEVHHSDYLESAEYDVATKFDGSSKSVRRAIVMAAARLGGYHG